MAGHQATRHWIWIPAIVVALALAVAYIQAAHPDGLDLRHPFGGHQQPTAGNAVNDAGTATATVERMTLSATTTVTGTLGYAGNYTVVGRAGGILTWLPGLGTVISQGHVLFRTDGSPVILLYGAVPAYRDLVAGTNADDLAGADVSQLNHDLVDLGYVSKDDVSSAWDEFNWATTKGVEKLQKHFHLDQTGKLSLGDVVFLPTAARVTALDVFPATMTDEEIASWVAVGMREGWAATISRLAVERN